MSVNGSSFVTNQNTTSLQVENTNNSSVNTSRLTRLFIGTVNNSGEPLTTNQLSEKAKMARIAGVVAMALGIVLCIAATALIVGVGLPIIPMAAIFALGLAACLYGAVLTTVAMNNIADPDPVIDQTPDQAIDEHDDLQQDTAPISRTDETSSADKEQTPLKLDFNLWLAKYEISSGSYLLNSIHEKKVSELTCEEFLELKNYDLSTMPGNFNPIIRNKLDYLLKDKNVSPDNKIKLLDLTKIFLDTIKAGTNPVANAQIKLTYNTLIPHLEKVRMQVIHQSSDIEEIRPIRSTDVVYSQLQDPNRFNINKKDGREEYTAIDGSVKYVHADILDLKNHLRLNSIYTSDNFYQGRYKQHASYQLIEMHDDFLGTKIEFIMVKPIPNAEPLSKDEKIPHSAITHLTEMGYFPHDINPEHFVKLYNSMTNQYEYIPVDASSIADKDSGSIRSKNIQRAKIIDKEAYKNPINISFSK